MQSDRRQLTVSEPNLNTFLGIHHCSTTWADYGKSPSAENGRRAAEEEEGNR